jgi:predicted ester cyclase
MTVQAQKAAIYLLMEIVNGGDLRAADEVCADDVLWHGSDGDCVRGLPAVRQLFGPTLTAFPDLIISIQDLVGECDRIACRFCWRGVHLGEFRGLRPSGITVAVTGLAFFRFARARVVEVWWHEDLPGLLHQLDAGTTSDSTFTVLSTRSSAAA